ncbi:carbohydrate kinase family protein [Brevibacillus dissolubilis]|uniref:carbohydrate kinase family protein n=1 Tax=Brevibacillus dissolubilis TaxID=1844116 RepID=UPI00159B930F|nr:carbohydrate kinase family protein [Brevibacillus dissolubilis]
MKKILVFGGVSYNLMIDVDEFPAPVPQTIHAKAYHEAVGSTGAGKSLALKRLGLDVVFHGVIGDDLYGEKIKELFRHEQIPFYYDIAPTGTERHTNLMKNHTGERLSIFLTSPPADTPLHEATIERLIQESDIIFLNIAPYCRKVIPMIKKHGKEIWCDLHSYDGASEYHAEFIQHADVLLYSSELDPNYRQTMQTWMAQGKKLAICTHASQGSTALLPTGEWIETPALPYKAVDTNGAGDSFFSGFLYGYLQGEPVRRCMQLATVTAGLTVTSRELIHSELSVGKLYQEYQRWYENI